MVFSKELFLNNISLLNDLQTMQYVTQEVLLFSLILLFLLPKIIAIFVRVATPEPNFWLVISISWAVELFLFIFLVLGFLPFFLQL